MDAPRSRERNPSGVAQSLPPSGSRWPSILRSAWALVLLALVIRGLALWATADAELLKDERAYVRRAGDLLDGEGYVGSFQSWVRHTDAYKIAELPQYPGAYQPPAYTTFVAAILAVSDRNPVAVKAVQVLIGSLTVLLVYLLGRAWFDHATGWWAALLFAVYPNLIAFTHLLWSETVYIALLLGLLYVLTRRTELPGRAACAGAGVLLGLVALTRSSIVYFLPFLVAWMIWQHRRDWKEGALRALVMCAVAGALVAPWSVRNYQIHDGFVLIDTNGPYNLWRGNTVTSYTRRYEPFVPHYAWPFGSIPVHPLAREVASVLVNQIVIETDNMSPTDLEVIAYASDSAWGYIRAHPVVFLKRVYYRMVDMWNPTSFMIRHFRLRAYGEVHPVVENAATIAAAVSYLLVLPLGIVGLALALRDSRIWLVVLLIGFFTGIAALAFGLTRFRLPLMPFFLIGAAHLLQLVRARRRGRAPDPAPA